MTSESGTETSRPYSPGVLTSSTVTQAVENEAIPAYAQKDNIPHYKYRPLNKEKQEIRLVRVLPGELHDPLRIEIVHVPFVVPDPVPDTRLSLTDLRKSLPSNWEGYETLEDRYLFYDKKHLTTTWDHPNPQLETHHYDSPAVLDPYLGYEPSFEALSYTWGTEKATELVGVLKNRDPAASFSDNLEEESKLATLSVRPHLFEALRHLRSQEHTRALWVDAISINQDDINERNEQVQRMANIFKLASRVVVWLGIPELSDSSIRGLETLQYLGKQVEAAKNFNLMPSPFSDHPDWCFLRQDLPHRQEDYVAINSLLERPWFDRLWIWQEIQLANHRTIMQVGRVTANWYAIRRGLILLYSKQRTCPTISSDLVRRRVYLCYKNYGLPLLDILKRTRRGEFLLEHDRIYAVLGLCEPTFASRLHVDYSVPISELFKNVCEVMLELDKSLSFLRYCKGPDNAIADAPTWIPNWLRAEHHSVGHSPRVSGTSGTGDARIVGSHLEVHGVECETIQYISSPAPVNGNAISTLRLWRVADSATGNYITTESMLEEFLTVVIGGHFQCDKDQRSATPTMQELKDFYMSEVVDGNEESRSINKTIKLRIAEITEGRCFFRAGNLVGHCSPATIPGDVVCVLLGLSQAIILRPREDSTYQVVGCAYVPGLFDGNALLPPLEPQWRVINTRNSKGNRTPSFQNPSEVSFEDPRLGPLPEGWEYVKGRKRDGTRTVTFRHLESRRKTHSDPRLSPEVLKARGIPIKTFHLA